MALNLTDLFEEMSSDEKARFDKLTSDDQLKLEKIFAMMAKEKAMKKEVMGIDRKGNEKPDTDGSDASKYKRAAMDVKEEKFSGEDEMQMHLKQYRDGNIDGDDLFNAFDEIINGSVSPPSERGFNTKYGMEEGFSPEAAKKSVMSVKDDPEKLKKFLKNLVGGISRGSMKSIDDLRNVLNAMEEEGIKLEESYGVTDQDPENDVVNVDKVSSPSAKGTNYGAETSSNDNEDNQEDKEIANVKPMYTENGDVDDFADELKEADPIPTEPGITKIGDDGKEYGVRASNHDRKMAMRSVIDILRDELSVGTSEAIDYIKTHKEDLFDGTVDAYDKVEVINDFKEYESVNEVSSSDYVDNIKKEKKVDEMESLKEHFNRFL